MLATSSIDFGYPWWLSYGHAAIFLPAFAGLIVGRARKWPVWVLVVLSLTAAWAAAAFFVMRSFDVNGRAEMPTQNFMSSGVGRVLDLGAGTGRSSIMVLSARPQATLVALDLFRTSQ